MQALVKRFLLISFLLPFHAIIAEVSKNIQPSVSVQDESQCVYLSKDVRDALCVLGKVKKQWSDRFTNLCNEIETKNRVSTSYAEAEAMVKECLSVCRACPELKEAEAIVAHYANDLLNGDANVFFIDQDGTLTRACGRKFKKGKAFCSLLTRDLRVCGPAVLDSLRVLGDSIFDGSVTFNSTVNFNGGVNIGGDTITTNGITNFGFFSSQSGQVAIVDGDPVEFETSNANNVGILHPNDTDFTVTTAGLYLIQFSTTTGTTTTGQQFGIRVNDVSVPTTIYGTGGVGASITGTLLTGYAFVRLSTTDVVTINNESGANITLSVTIGGSDTNNSAAITFLRIAA